MSGTVNGEEYAFYVTSGTKPDAVFGFEASSGSGGWDQLFYFDETTYDKVPVQDKSLKTLVNATQYYIPLSTSSQSFVYDSLEVGNAIINDTLFFAYDSVYIMDTGDSLKFVVDDTEAFRAVNVGADVQTIFDPLGTFGTAANPTVAFSDGNTGFYESADNTIMITTAAGNRFYVAGNTFAGVTSGGPAVRNSGMSSTNPGFTGSGNLNSGLSIENAADTIYLITGGVEAARFTEGAGIVATHMFGTTFADLTSTADTYYDLINMEWTAGADMAAGGSNGIYSIANPVEDVQNTYALRGRMDLRDAGAAVDVNQLHAVDALINFNTSYAYDVVDNISVVGAAVHGAGANITGDGALDEESLNLFYGVWGPTATQNFEITTNGILLMSHAATYLDYGATIENSGAMTAGLYLNNHPSNSPATMTSGILMESAASKMTYGINMTGASITTADILFQNGALINNGDASTLTITEAIVEITGAVTVSASMAATGIVSGNTGITLDTDPAIVLTAAMCKNMARYNNDAGVIDYTLPPAAIGLVVGFYDRGPGVITIDPFDGTDEIELNGTPIGAGDEIDSPGAAGDFIVLMAIDDTTWVTWGRSGVWVDANP